ncbi:MAG: hypothetical protein NTY48_06600 [Candidatus Diapherotrites archaeon]|nr:hypothetical protein [Candidatus Diapherotrites archaeon]
MNNKKHQNKPSFKIKRQSSYIKGQIFATDVLIAISLAILGIGLIASTAEFNLYNKKQNRLGDELIQTTETAAAIITNSTWSDCNFGITETPFSINWKKLQKMSSEQIKQKLSLQGYPVNISLLIGEKGNSIATKSIINDTINTDNISSIDLNVFVCSDAAKDGDLTDCMNRGVTCKNGVVINSGTLTIQVGK